MATTAERVGQNVKEWRVHRKLTQQELGERVGSDNSRIGRIEKGIENLTFESLDKIADALDVDVADLFRPEEASGRADSRRLEAVGILEALVSDLDAEAPAEDSWRGDVLKAIAALNRALRRGSDSSAAGDTPATAGR